MSAELPSIPDGFDPEAVELWGEYAKDRYEAQEKRLADLRGWARQLAAGMGAVVGVEAALTLQVLSLGGTVLPRLWLPSLCFLLGAIGYQLLILANAVRVGYVGQELLGAESPAVLSEHFRGKDKQWAQRTIGSYYAKGADSVYAVAEDVGKRVGVVAKRFRVSLVLLFAVMVLTSGLRAVSSHAGKTMAETPSSSGPAPSAPAPASEAPAAPPSAAPASPLLVTPTPGQVETHGVTPPRQTLISTPTPGQRLTEGVDGKRR